MPKADQTNRGSTASTLFAIALTVVAITGFSRPSFNVTLVVSLTALTCLLVFFWAVGRRKRLRQGLGADHTDDSSTGI